MVENVYLVDSENINPFHNLALQAHLINNIPDDSLVFWCGGIMTRLLSVIKVVLILNVMFHNWK